MLARAHAHLLQTPPPIRHTHAGPALAPRQHRLRNARAAPSALGAAGPSLATTLAFTPQHAALGGAILGVAVVGNLLLNGRVLGISGAVK